MNLRKTLQRLWADDGGALISSEWLFVATILVLGMVVGLAYVRDSVTAGLYEFGNAVNALPQDYKYSSLAGCGSYDWVIGVDAQDNNADFNQPGIYQPPTVAVVDVFACAPGFGTPPSNFGPTD